MNKELLYHGLAAAGGAFLVGNGFAHIVSEGLSLGPILLSVGGFGMSTQIISRLQSQSNLSNAELVGFGLVLFAVSVLSGIWYLSVIG